MVPRGTRFLRLLHLRRTSSRGNHSYSLLFLDVDPIAYIRCAHGKMYIWEFDPELDPSELDLLTADVEIARHQRCNRILLLNLYKHLYPEVHLEFIRINPSKPKTHVQEYK